MCAFLQSAFVFYLFLCSCCWQDCNCRVSSVTGWFQTATNGLQSPAEVLTWSLFRSDLPGSSL
uniref:Secreted protein n=1 Tax=Anguilla anguilla TaxID=7936 RepID=A0A0E9WYU4_ANGAN